MLRYYDDDTDYDAKTTWDIKSGPEYIVQSRVLTCTYFGKFDPSEYVF